MIGSLKFSIIIIALAGITVSCKKVQIQNKPNPIQVQINAQNSGQTTTLAPGQNMLLTLPNPGDGGYQFDPPQYNDSIITLKNHTRIVPVKAATGDFGSDAWEFTAANKGSGYLTITATRGTIKSSTIVIFKGMITVQ